MRPAPLSPALTGHTLGKTVYAADGNPLLTAGTRLTAQMIQTLRNRGYASVIIRNEFFPDLETDEAVGEETRVRTVALAKKAMEALTDGRQVSLTPVNRAVDELINALECRPPGHVHTLYWQRSIAEEIYAHSVNVCILSLIVGIGLGYSRSDLHKLGVGALFHDVGKLGCGELHRKATPLTPEEWELAKTHSRAGYDLLHDRAEISLLSAHVAWQHHERLDGSGYPRGLKGPEIHEFARIAAVANAFDALVADRPYRNGTPPHLVVGRLQPLAGRHLDPKMTGILFSRLERYPVGTIVTLVTGEVAVVTGQNAWQPERPRVRVVADRDHRLISPYDLNLAEHTAAAVREVLGDYPARVREHLADGSRGTV